MQQTENETTALVSINRPLTRAARRALKEYGIVDEQRVNENNRWTVVEVEEQPPTDVLDQHELAIDEEPIIYEADNGDLVEIHEKAGVVFASGVETNLEPEEARERAEANGWEVREE